MSATRHYLLATNIEYYQADSDIKERYTRYFTLFNEVQAVKTYRYCASKTKTAVIVDQYGTRYCWSQSNGCLILPVLQGAGMRGGNVSGLHACFSGL